jgi:5-methylcytosine-specific restriction protein A
MIDIIPVTRALVNRYGFNLTASEGKDERGEYVDFQLAELPATVGFLVRVRIGWRSIEAEFVPGNFSAGLIKALGRASLEKRALFRSFAQSATESGDQIIMRLNDLNADPLEYSSWPKNWSSFHLTIRRTPIAIDDETTTSIEEAVLSCGGRLLAMVTALLPAKETTPREASSGLPEGAKIRVEANRYERNPLNRAACIEANGTRCAVCGFDFSERYGEIGNGYIHVHHIVPVAQLGEGYVIDPAKDLVPVCPNCHAMLHQKDPPYTVEELRALIQCH